MVSTFNHEHSANFSLSLRNSPRPDINRCHTFYILVKFLFIFFPTFSRQMGVPYPKVDPKPELKDELTTACSP